MQEPANGSATAPLRSTSRYGSQITSVSITAPTMRLTRSASRSIWFGRNPCSPHAGSVAIARTVRSACAHGRPQTSTWRSVETASRPSPDSERRPVTAGFDEVTQARDTPALVSAVTAIPW